MNGCQSCSFYSKRAWNIFHYFQWWKVKVNLETGYLATPQHPKNRWDICKIFFSDFGCNFLLLGGVFHECSKSKYHSIHQNNFFGTHFVSRFLLFSPFCMPTFLKTFSSSDFWGAKKGPCKEFHVFGENWQRNIFPKLTTLWFILQPMRQLCHSALRTLHFIFCIGLQKRIMINQ